MALVLPLAHTTTAAGKKVAQKRTVIVEEKCLNTCIYDKEFLAVLFDIYEKGGKVSETHHSKIEKISNSITGEKESRMVFRVLCALSFLGRYQNKSVITDVFSKLDNLISNPHWTMFHHLEDECFQLLTRMGTIEDLSSLDRDLICLLCTLCRNNSDNPSLNSLLFEVGRSVWPYMNRSLWESEPFVDFISDILEVAGSRLEQLHPKNFNLAWKVVLKNLIGVSITSYSRLRLLSVVEHRSQMWILPEETREFYNQQYKEFMESKKKEVFSFLGYLPSKRKISLTVKPGRSAADFLKRRLSSDGQEKEERSSSSSSNCGSSVELSDVCEDVFETDENETSCPIDIKDNSSDSDTVLKQNGSYNNKSDSDNYVEQVSSLVDNSLVQSSPQEMNEIESNDKAVAEDVSPQTVTGEELSSKVSKDDDTMDTTSSSNDLSPRSRFLERKKIIIKVPKKYVGRVIGARGTVIISIQEQTGATINFLKDKGDVLDENKESEFNHETQDETEKEGDFEIIGTDESIRKAKQEIEYIVKTMQSRATLTRSYSEVTPRRGFKQIYRSLSCPIGDWGDSCKGDCANCKKGCYCRAFLLSQSETPSAWVRPDDLSITRDADWSEFIIKIQVNDLSRTLSRDDIKSSSDDVNSSSDNVKSSSDDARLFGEC